MREYRSLSPTNPFKQIKANPYTETSTSAAAETTHPVVNTEHPITEKQVELPKVGDMVNVPSLNRKATVLKLDPSKKVIVLQAGNVKLKLKLDDIVTR
ncbi:hypothetical protein OROMI_027489 [Orobanche minor]